MKACGSRGLIRCSIRRKSKKICTLQLKPLRGTRVCRKPRAWKKMFSSQPRGQSFSRSWNIWKKRWQAKYGTLNMTHPVIAVSDSVFPNLNLAREVLSRVGAELLLAEEPTPEAIMQVARNADAVLVTYAKITAEMISQMRRCRIIARFGIGVDNVDIPAATKAGIGVTRVPDYCLDEVSDHAMALLLALARKIAFANSRAHAGHWEMPAVVPIYRWRGSVLGLVGFGRIPQLVAPKAKAFGLKVISYDPVVSQETMNRAGVEKVEFSELVSVSDHISD